MSSPLGAALPVFRLVQTSARLADDAKVGIDNFAFTPAVLTVKPGTTVIFENHDDIPHLVVDADGKFRSKALDTNDKFSVTFDKPGEYRLFLRPSPAYDRQDHRHAMSVGGAVTGQSTQTRFAEVVLPHLDDAYGLARWLTGNRSDAEDVVQDACMRALASLDAASIERPRAWVLSIVRNTAFTWLAKNRPKTVLLTDDAQLHRGGRREGARRAESGGGSDRGGRSERAGIGDRSAAASFQGSYCDARHQWLELSRNRCGDRRAGRNGDVAPCAGAGAADRQAGERKVTMRDDPTLLLHAALDGELDAAGMIEIEAKLAADPALAAEYARLGALRDGDQGACCARGRAGLIARARPVDGAERKSGAGVWPGGLRAESCR